MFQGLRNLKKLNRMDGHDVLMRDLIILINEAQNFEFHDFKNTKYAAPKIALITALEAMIIKAKTGAYDNYNE